MLALIFFDQITANTVPSGDPHNHEKRITINELSTSSGNVVSAYMFK